MRLLHPQASDDVSVESLYGAVERPTPRGRPWVMCSMISSLDGATAVDGRSKSLGNTTDWEVYQALRGAADLILVGASTVRAEQYRMPAKVGQRVAVVTASARIDLDQDLFRSGAGLLVMPQDGPDVAVESVRVGKGQVDLGLALVGLAERTGCRTVLCEGGSTLNGAMIANGTIDELCWTISPNLVAGRSPRLSSGPVEWATPMRLAHLAIEGSFLFTRYLRADHGNGPEPTTSGAEGAVQTAGA